MNTKKIDVLALTETHGNCMNCNMWTNYIINAETQSKKKYKFIKLLLVVNNKLKKSIMSFDNESSVHILLDFGLSHTILQK